MKNNSKNNLKILMAFIVIAACFVSIIMNVEYKSINIKNISLFIIIIASVYFGIVFERKRKDSKKEVDEGKVIKSSTQNIPEEFKDEEDRFKKLNEKGMLG